MTSSFAIPYSLDEKYTTPVAYFSMEFAIHQALKIYSGGLGFLSGSHLRSAYELRQNMVGIGILWKYGYYDQVRNDDQTMRAQWIEKEYSFLEDTGILFQVPVHGADVWVKALYLHPETFQTAPLFLLTTDIPENDYLSRTITHKLYDDNEATKLAQYIILGIGGAKLMDVLQFEPAVYHLNEAHALPAAFYLLDKFKSVETLQSKLVFTTHTPEKAGNEVHRLPLCKEMGYFYHLSLDEVRRLLHNDSDQLDLSLTALQLARKANGVSRLHGIVARDMWNQYPGVCPIISITNAQDYAYWADKQLYQYVQEGNIEKFQDRKRYLKYRTFEIVADQTGKLFQPEVLTIVWSRRFAGYKRANLLLRDIHRLESILQNKEMPIQLIWAGKPYPLDTDSVQLFNYLVEWSKKYPNVAVVTGYELHLSKRLKQAADIWLNNPRVPREASGTSGMTAAMNGAINFSSQDGWIPEFIQPGKNGFVLPLADYKSMSTEAQDDFDANNLYQILQEQILPMYYQQEVEWQNIIAQSMQDVKTQFDSKRMADEYYSLMYNA